MYLQKYISHLRKGARDYGLKTMYPSPEMIPENSCITAVNVEMMAWKSKYLQT